MELQDLQGFAAVVRTGSFSRAAAATYRSQPAISLQVARLEKELDVPLLDRSSRHVRPTREGAALATLAEKVLESVRQMKNLSRAPATGDLVIGASQSIAALLLPEALRKFRRKFPAVNVRVHTDASLRLLASVAAGQMDLAVLSMALTAPGVQVRPFRKYHFVAVGGDVAMPLILPPAGSAMNTHIQGALLAAGIAPRVVLETASMELAVALAKAGIGTAIVPSFAGTGRRLDYYIPPQTLCLAWRAGTSDLARDALADLLRCGRPRLRRTKRGTAGGRSVPP